jgi:hypothetical protein
MLAAVPLFYDNVVSTIEWALVVIFLVIEVVALVHCATQRADAFPVVGSISKAGWLAILGGAILVTFICRLYFLGFFAIVAAAIYLLDVRPALRDATDGAGPW